MLPRTQYNELVDGLTLLSNLSLSFAPQTDDDLDRTLEAWEFALSAYGRWSDRDNGRIALGFAKLATELDKWPSPKQLIERLPPPPSPPRLAAPKFVPPTPAQQQMLRTMISELSEGMRPTSQPQTTKKEENHETR